MSIITLDNVHKSFGALKVLDGVSFSVDKGEGVRHHRPQRLRQEHGAALHRPAGAHRPGAHPGVRPRGERPGLDLRQLRRDVGIVFQSYNLFPHLTAAENIALAPRHSKGKTRAEANELTARVLAQVGLSDKADSYPSNSRAASSSAWPSRARSRWSRRSCCSTRSRRPSTRSSRARSSR
jgi:polar amino acid transport system ATP-binding protein